MKTINRTADAAAQKLFTRAEAHLLEDGTPSGALRELIVSPECDVYPFSMLKKLEGTPSRRFTIRREMY